MMYSVMQGYQIIKLWFYENLHERLPHVVCLIMTCFLGNLTDTLCVESIKNNFKATKT